jgi:hypothetical protein
MHRTLFGVLLSAAAPLAGCADEASVSTHEPASDRILTLSAGEEATIIADAGGSDNGDMPQCVREQLREAVPTLQLVVASEFRRIAGPRFSITPKTVEELRTILVDPAVQAAARRMMLRFLVIVGGKTDSEDNPDRQPGKRTRVEANVWDVPAAEHVGEFAVEVWNRNSSPFSPVAPADTEGIGCVRVAEMLARRLGRT